MLKYSGFVSLSRESLSCRDLAMMPTRARGAGCQARLGLMHLDLGDLVVRKLPISDQS